MLCNAGLEGSRKFMPVERELVFDIDLTDYDDVRTCGKGAHICNKCWPLMAIAIKVCYISFSLYWLLLFQRELSLHQIARFQEYHCSQNAVMQ